MWVLNCVAERTLDLEERIDTGKPMGVIPRLLMLDLSSWRPGGNF